MDKGIYCLLFENPACTVCIGALGDIPFRAGWHLYIGSALGSGGLQRVSRHIALASDRNRLPKWHVDYLILHRHFRLRYTVCAATTARLECSLAAAIGGEGVPGFGCSDCSCPSHLLYRDHDPVPLIVRAFRTLGLTPFIKTIMRDEAKRNI